MLAMVCDIMAGLMNPEYNPTFGTLDSALGVVLIDEVEAHLHPSLENADNEGIASGAA
ncbi:Predicted ATP-binding protein involved in virulence [Raoultella terrigena]|uniref:Predicted ATP-binding protein involved in virulence n=1 Tax=Raoultella terrigena TaxID=577 RepID=A0A3P8JS16_RAOTE|nr:Predicted ATP-binding protein involved in virulence [Raoultella terrigena]